MQRASSSVHHAVANCSRPQLYKICPTTTFRYDGVEGYLYRWSDGKCWNAQMLTHPMGFAILRSLARKPSSIAEVSRETGLNANEVSAALAGLVDCDLAWPANEYTGSTAKLTNAVLNRIDSLPFTAAAYHLRSARIEKIDYGDSADAKSYDTDVMHSRVENEPIPPNHYPARRSEH
jgi:IclR helix-turn-helix domain